MRLLDRWRGLQESYRREFDERAQRQQLRAVRDAFIALTALLVVFPLLSALALPQDVRQAALIGLPLFAISVAAVVFLVSSGVRGAFTRRRALIFAGTYLTGTLLAAAGVAIAVRDVGTGLGLVAGATLAAVLNVATAWRNG